MKYYYRYPGDITIKTGHLTPAEMGCYDRLMDHCYSTEAPIPAGRAHSICRALTPDDQAACDNVLREFFSLVEGGWVQQRIGEEIVKAQGRITAARENGKKGGRPPKRASQKPTGFSTETQLGTQDTTQQKALQTPISSSTKKKRAAVAPLPSIDPTVLVEAGFDAQAAADFIAHKATLKAPLTERAWKDHLREASRAGWTPLQAAEKVMAKGWKGFEAKYVASESPPARSGGGGNSNGGGSGSAAPGAEATRRMLEQQAAIQPTKPPAEIRALLPRKVVA